MATTWTVDESTVTADNPQFTADGLVGSPAALFRVRAVAAGYYGGRLRAVGDVFDIPYDDYSDSTKNYVTQEADDPDSPFYGWMILVPNNTPLYDQSLQGSTCGLVSGASGTYGRNSQGVLNLSIRRTVY